jgi:tRNA pseudouridine65 synthase
LQTPVPPAPSRLPPIELLYVDPHVVVANKPSGLLVHRGWDNDDDVAMFRVRDALGGEHVYPVHRLDRGTSGALLLARTRDAAAALGRAIELRQLDKRYLALVRGAPPDSGVIDYAIPKSDDGPRVEAVTHFRVLARSPVDRCALVLAVPETGRLHQLRRHFAHIHHPLVGDVKHGSGEINRHYRATYALHRLALHAIALGFDHPFPPEPDAGSATGKAWRVEVLAPLPMDFAQALQALQLPWSEEDVRGAGRP